MLFKPKPIIERQFFKWCHKRYVIQKNPKGREYILWAISEDEEYYFLGTFKGRLEVSSDIYSLAWDVQKGAEKLYRKVYKELILRGSYV